jgi:predicted ATPase
MLQSTRLILKAAENTQIWVVTHSPALISSLLEHSEARLIELHKDFGQTQVKGQNVLDRPQWRWVE